MLDFFTDSEKPMTCPRCSWRGLGKELASSEFSELHFIVDFTCPKCGHEMGSMQYPMQAKVDAYMREHPDWKVPDW